MAFCSFVSGLNNPHWCVQCGKHRQDDIHSTANLRKLAQRSLTSDEITRWLDAFYRDHPDAPRPEKQSAGYQVQPEMIPVLEFVVKNSIFS